MKNKILVTFFVVAFVFITSCDNSPSGGNAEGFGTVYLTAEFAEALYEADAITCDDITPDDGFCDGCGFVNDAVEITLFSTVYETLPEGVTASAIMIDSYLVQFVARDTYSPAIPDKPIGQNIEVPAGSSLTFPFRVISQADKDLWYDAYVASGRVAWEYTVIISIFTEEVTTGESETIQVQFPLDYLDLDDGCT